jgi:hypothetical protein
MKNDFQPVVGHRFNFRATPMPNWNGLIDCEVLVVEPNSRLSYRRPFGQPSLEGSRWPDRFYVPGDEKAGLLRDAIRSQCSTCSKHNEKETGNEKD